MVTPCSLMREVPNTGVGYLFSASCDAIFGSKYTAGGPRPSRLCGRESSLTRYDKPLLNTRDVIRFLGITCLKLVPVLTISIVSFIEATSHGRSAIGTRIFLLSSRYMCSRREKAKSPTRSWSQLGRIFSSNSR